VKGNGYTVPAKKVTTKARNAEKVEKDEYFPKPDVFLRSFPPN
jgi:hypothetical protein